jgi:hypothetical protein
MSKAIFPIVEVNDHKIISIDGNTSYFYKIKSPDLEQLGPIEIESFYSGIASGIEGIAESSYVKFCRLGREAYLETDSTELPYFSGVEFKKEDNPLGIFFGTNGIYSDIGIYDDYLSFNGNYIRLFSAYEFSEDEIEQNFIPYDVDYVLNIKRFSKEKSISLLERIRTGHLSSFLKAKRDISSEGTYAQAEELLYDLTHGQEMLFQMELFFLMRAYSLEELNAKSNAFQIEMRSRGLKVYSEGQSLLQLKSGLATLFNELMPGVRPKLKLRQHLNKTAHLKYLLPIGNSHLMDDGVLFHDLQDNEIFFDPFFKEIKNRNMLVTGTSGAGKSVFVNKLVHHLIDRHPTVILDKGGSFKRLALFHEGNILSSGFNPLQFKDPLYLREIILSVVDRGKFGKLEQGKLLKLIKENVCKVSSFAELIGLLSSELVGIEHYFEEVWGYFTDEHLDFKKILYVDVENYPKGIIAPLIIFILEYFKNINVKEKILVFDECWSFLKDHSSYIDECFRTFRKTGAFPIAISQAERDFFILDKKLGQAISNNSYFKVYFPQELESTGNLSSFDIEKIKLLRFEKGNYSECYLKTPDNRFQKTIRNYLTPLEYELFHTDAGGDEKLLQFLDQFGQFFGSIPEAIKSFVRLKHETSSHSDILFSIMDHSKSGTSEHVIYAR